MRSNNIRPKFLEDFTLQTIAISDDIESSEIPESEVPMKGAIFPLSGKEKELMLLGNITKDSKKLYIDGFIDLMDGKKKRIVFKGIEYNVDSHVGEFPTNTLNTYFISKRF